jgi:adenosylcobinamide-GDP ribazoletransferase
MKPLSELRAAVSFLTPLGRSGAEPSAVTMTYFPLVGAALGTLVGLTWRAACRSFPPVVSAALATGADSALTGALHLDGLADTADGLLAHVPSRSRLAIMSEPQIGSFAAVAVSLATVTRVAALSALEPSPALLSAIYCSSRSLMVVASRCLPYAREEGVATAFLSGDRRDQAFLAALAGAGGALALATAVAGRRGTAAVVAGWGAGALVLEGARRRLGGFTGDVLGAAGVACETSGLVIASMVNHA